MNIKSLNKKQVVGSAALLSFVAAVNPTNAQETTSGAVDTNPGMVLQEVVVTAQRRAERLEDVPISVTAISSEALKNLGGSGVRDLERITPGLMVGSSGAFTAPAIRGITTLLINTNIENNVAVYVDGFYEPNTIAINADLPDIESVEVLKGPQGTLYGRNATGGAILVNTRSPSKEMTGEVEFTYARFDDRRTNIFLSGPLTDAISFSVAGYHRESDGYVDLQDPDRVDGTDGSAAPLEHSLIRAKIAAQLGESINATLGYTYSDSDDPRGVIFSTFAHRGGLLPPPPATVENRERGAYQYKTSSPAETHQGTLKLELDTDVGMLTSRSSYGRRESGTFFDFDGSYVDITHGEANYPQDTWQQSFDFVEDIWNDIDLIVGGLYYHDQIGTDSNNIQSFGPGGVLAVAGDTQGETESWALYADSTFQLTEKISLNVGGRYTDETKKQEAKLFTGSGFVFFPETSVSASFSKFTPRASVIYALSDASNIYASYSEGFRSGQFNQFGAETTGSWRAVEPESITAYEIGFKSSGSNYQFDTAVFYYDYSDLQVQQLRRSVACPPEPEPCGTLFQVFQNADEAEIYGAEAQLSFNPVENLTLRAGLSLLEAQYTKFEDAAATGLDPLADRNITQQQDWSDKDMVRAPEYSGNIGFDYSIPSDRGGLLISANLSFTDDYVVSNPSLFGPLVDGREDEQRYVQEGYELLDATVTWTHPQSHYWVAIFGTNLTDEEYSYNYTGGTFGDYGVYADPLTWGLRIGAGF